MKRFFFPVIKLSQLLKKWIGIALAALVAMVILLLAVDVPGSYESSQKIFFTDSFHLIYPVIVIVTLANILFRAQIMPQAKRFLLWLVIIPGALVTIALSIWDFVTPLNTVYAATRINYQEIGHATIFAFFIWLASHSWQWWKQNYTKVLLWLPYVIFAILTVLRSWPLNYFLEVVKEDRTIEDTQFTVLVIGGVWCISLAIQFLGKKKLLYGVAYGLMAMAMLVVAGEEVSWGQRYFGLQTPEELAAVNLQNETNFHNIEGIDWSIQPMYFLISILLIVLHSILWLIPWSNKQRWYSWFPSPRYWGYFVFPAVFFTQQRRIMWGIWHEWSEPAELFLYTGAII